MAKAKMDRVSEGLSKLELKGSLWSLGIALIEERGKPSLEQYYIADVMLLITMIENKKKSIYHYK